MRPYTNIELGVMIAELQSRVKALEDLLPPHKYSQLNKHDVFYDDQDGDDDCWQGDTEAELYHDDIGNR